MLGFNTLYKTTKTMEKDMNKLAIAGFTLFSTLTPPTSPNKVKITPEIPEKIKPKIEVKCDSVVNQGQMATININTNTALNKPYYIFGQRKAPIYKCNDSTYMGLVGTTPDDKGIYKIIVSDSSKTFTDTLNLEVKPCFFSKRMLPSRPPGKRELKPGEPVATPKELEIEKIRNAEDSIVRNAINSPSEVNFYEPPPYNWPTTGQRTGKYGSKGVMLKQRIDTVLTPKGKKVYMVDFVKPYFHKGNDFRGKEIRAILPGKVLVADTFKYSDNGWPCIIDHGMGLKSIYLHTKGFFVKKGQIVQKGQLIALVGNTGYSFGDHLHFQIDANGVPVNPELLLTPAPADPNRILAMKATESPNRIVKMNAPKNQIQKVMNSMNADSLRRVQTKASSSLKRTAHLVK